MAGEVSIDRRLAESIRAATGSGADVQSADLQPSYYDVPMLQAPVWEGLTIGGYFFLGGLSGGAYLISRMAGLFGGREYRDLARAGSTVALLAALPCAPLLIADLGDPKRFHHMLRVFKPTSPMNVGTWVVSGYSAAAAAAVVRESVRSARGEPRTPGAKAADKTLAVITDAAGIPLALVMMCYTGVLLSGTATPVWTGNKWLAPLFSASAMSNGSGAISLALQFMKRRRWLRRESPAERALEKIDTAAHIAEIAFLVQYLTSLGRLNRPLTSGKHSGYMIASAAGLLASEMLKYAPLHGRKKRWAKIASACLGIGSGFALKYGILQAGTPSANDPQANRISSSRAGQKRQLAQPRRKFPVPPDTRGEAVAGAKTSANVLSL
jgi:formate-dependent nitrite reductase membrane component NrfD